MIVLVGYMGSGKTTVGMNLAEELGCDFIDLDHKIEERVGKNIPQIFDLYGEYFFRKVEYLVLKEEIRKREGGVLATGGGTPIHYNSMDFINSEAHSVYLKLTPEFLFKRLKETSEHRPILLNKNDSELLKFIKTHLEQREPFYSKANHIIINNSLQETVKNLKNHIKSNSF